MRRFELEPFLANIERYKINDVGIVPPIVIAIIMSGLAKKYSMASVRHLVVGAAPLSKESQHRIRELMSPEARVNQVWGMTEMSCIASHFPYPTDDTSGSIGYILPNIDAKYISKPAVS